MADSREIIEIRELGVGRPMFGNPGRHRWLVIFNANARDDGRPVQVWHAWREETRDRAVEKVTADNRKDYDEIEVRHTCLIEGSES